MNQRVQLDLAIDDAGWVDGLPDLFQGPDVEAGDRLVEVADKAFNAGRGDRFGGVPVTVALLLADDGHIADLNERFRNKSGPTNILSFPDGSESGDRGDVHLGDLALARETVFREAVEQAKSPQDHMLHLVVHGILHLLGYDHVTDELALEMESLERHILADLGIADPYEPDEPATAGAPAQRKGPCTTESTAFTPR